MSQSKRPRIEDKSSHVFLDPSETAGPGEPTMDRVTRDDFDELRAHVSDYDIWDPLSPENDSLARDILCSLDPCPLHQILSLVYSMQSETEEFCQRVTQRLDEQGLLFMNRILESCFRETKSCLWKNKKMADVLRQRYAMTWSRVRYQFAKRLSYRTLQTLVAKHILRIGTLSGEYSWEAMKLGPHLSVLRYDDPHIRRLLPGIDLNGPVVHSWTKKPKSWNLWLYEKIKPLLDQHILPVLSSIVCDYLTSLVLSLDSEKMDDLKDVAQDLMDYKHRIFSPAESGHCLLMYLKDMLKTAKFFFLPWPLWFHKGLKTGVLSLSNGTSVDYTAFSRGLQRVMTCSADGRYAFGLGRNCIYAEEASHAWSHSESYVNARGAQTLCGDVINDQQGIVALLDRNRNIQVAHFRIQQTIPWTWYTVPLSTDEPWIAPPNADYKMLLVMRRKTIFLAYPHELHMIPLPFDVSTQVE